jgi:predicted ribosomally synthesized peptide with nif11-like leader
VSIEDLSAFFDKLQSDEDLRDRAFGLQGGGAAHRIDGLCSLAQEHGFDVKPEDWEHEAAGPAVAALDDESLRKVVGGACDSPGLGGGPHSDEPFMGL